MSIIHRTRIHSLKKDIYTNEGDTLFKADASKLQHTVTADSRNTRQTWRGTELAAQQSMVPVRNSLS